MREIKFRAWVPSKKILCDVLTFDFNEKTAQLPIETEVNAPYWRDVTSWSFKDIKLPQYTGLKDKNGIEIYEGDIIRSGKDSPIGTIVTAKVYWKGAGFALLTTRGSDTTSAYLELLSPFCEVIGNIHEHPHLLKGE